MRCPSCQSSVADDAATCPECGTRLAQSTGGRPGATRETAGQSGDEPTKPKGAGEPTPSSDAEGDDNRGHDSDGPDKDDPETTPRDAPSGRGDEPEPEPPAGGGGEGQPDQAGSAVADHAGPPGSGQPEPADSGHAGPLGGTPRDDGARRDTAGQRRGEARPARRAGATVGLRERLSVLPWRTGALAGGVVSVLGLALCWAVGTQLVTSDAGAFGVRLFSALLALEPLQTVASQEALAGRLAVEGPLLGYLGDVARGRYDPAVGVVYVLVAWLLYATGRSVGRRYAGETDRTTAVAAGVVVAAGTLPVMAPAALALGDDFGDDAVVAGLMFPAALGVAGSGGAYLFRGYRRSTSWGTGVLAGLVGLGVCFALTFVWTPGGAPSDLFARVLAWLMTFVGVVVGGFAAGADGYLAYLAVGLPLFGLGVLRARRGAVDVTGPVEGARAGATVLAGFSVVVFLAASAYAVLGVVTSEFVRPSVSPLVYLPTAVLPPQVQAAVAEQPGLVGGTTIGLREALGGADVGIPLFVTLGNYLQAVVVGGVLFPALVGGACGALGGYLAGRDRAPAGTTSGRGASTGGHGGDRRERGTASQTGRRDGQEDAGHPAGDAGRRDRRGEHQRGGRQPRGDEPR